MLGVRGRAAHRHEHDGDGKAARQRPDQAKLQHCQRPPVGRGVWEEDLGQGAGFRVQGSVSVGLRFKVGSRAIGF